MIVFLSVFIYDLFMIEFMMKFMISGPLGPGRARPRNQKKTYHNQT